MKKLFRAVVVIVLCVISVVPVAAQRDSSQTLTHAFIRYEQLDWQTYDFYVQTNVPEDEIVRYEWTVDRAHTFSMPRIQQHFDPGRHEVTLMVTDSSGMSRYDRVILDIQFWSLYNGAFWWFVFASVILLIVFYWVLKIMYLFNLYNVRPHPRSFLDILNTHGLIDHMIEGYIQKRHANSNQ